MMVIKWGWHWWNRTSRDSDGNDVATDGNSSMKNYGRNGYQW